MRCHQSTRLSSVASIKPNNSSTLPPLNPVVLMVLRNGAMFARNGRYAMQGINATTLSVLIQAAYGVRDFQILEAPGWVNSDRYDVDARAAEGTTFEQMRPMLQSRLADRFKLVLRRETRQLPVYELVPARDGLEIVPTSEGAGAVTFDAPAPPALQGSRSSAQSRNNWA